MCVHFILKNRFKMEYYFDCNIVRSKYIGHSLMFAALFAGTQHKTLWPVLPFSTLTETVKLPEWYY